MSLQCPHCQTVQAEENCHCTQCGELLEALQSKMPLFRFAEPILVAEPLASGEEAIEKPSAVEESDVREKAASAEDMTPKQSMAPKKVGLPVGKIAALAEKAAIPAERAAMPAGVSMAVPMAAEEKKGPAVPELRLPWTEAVPPTSQAERETKGPLLWKLPALAALVSLALILCALAVAGRILFQARQMADGRTAQSLGPEVLPLPTVAPATTADLAPSDSEAASLPLELTLQSPDAGRHVPIGAAVRLTAFATLAPGQSATLALSYRAPAQHKTLFSFAEGRLCSAIWTPASPGRYEFTATAHEGRRHVAVSRPLWIFVDGPAPLTARAPMLPLAVMPITGPIVRISRSLSEWRAPRRLVHALPRRPPPVPAALPAAYHVAAASFPYPRNAEVLAQALRAQGLSAVTRRRRGKHGRVIYVVETGVYPQEGEARNAALALQRSGYPAYTQRSR